MQPPQLECPHCGRHTVVMHGESLYVCLSCDWVRDLNRARYHHDSHRFSFFGLMVLALLAIVLISRF